MKNYNLHNGNQLLGSGKLQRKSRKFRVFSGAAEGKDDRNQAVETTVQFWRPNTRKNKIFQTSVIIILKIYIEVHIIILRQVLLNITWTSEASSNMPSMGRK